MTEDADQAKPGIGVDRFCQQGRLPPNAGGLMATMNVSLSNEFVSFVEHEVASGAYGTASEVVRDALRLLRREKAGQEEKHAILRREVAAGVAQAHAGRLSKRSVAEISDVPDAAAGQSA